MNRVAKDQTADEPITRPMQTLGEIGLWQFAPYLMNRIMARYNTNVKTALLTKHLTTPKMRTLAVLAVVPGLTINELSVYAVTEQSTMSRTLEAMEKSGLIRRQARESDARVREIYLTDKGRTVFDSAWPDMFARYEQMFTDIPDSDRATFVVTLQKILSNLRLHDI
jgi:MarR family transcriptional regulator for hemolysin